MTADEISILSADKPVTDPQYDRLSYASFAQNLAESICRMAPPEGLVMAIHGPWGSGKTTLVSFVVHFLRQKPEQEQPLLVQFNPWWFSGSEDLTRRFFDQLQVGLSKWRAFEKDFTRQVAGLAELVAESPIPYGEMGKPIARMLRQSGRDVPELKRKVADMLRKQQKRILVVIDDIDRLTADEIRQLFRLIKAVADFPNVVYLLAFDREVAIKALTEAQGISGEAYLEKIVQVPFELPLPDKTSLRQLLFEKLEVILAGSPEVQLDQIYWGNVFFEGVDHFISTPRDVVRLTNALAVTFPVVRGEVNPVDFIGIEALRLFCPMVYEAVRRNAPSFVGHAGEIGFPIVTQENLRVFHDSWLGQVPDVDKEAAKRLLMRLFPRLESVWSNVHYGVDYFPIWRRDLRVCSPDIFPVFFRLAVPEGSVTHKEMETLLALATDAKAFGAKLVELAGQRRSGSVTRTRTVIERLGDYTERAITHAQIPSIIAAMLDVGDQLLDQEEDESRGPLDFGSQWSIARVNWQLLRRLDESARFATFSEGIAVGGSLSTIVHEVVLLGRQHGKYDAQREAPENEKLVSFEHLATLEKMSLQKVRSKAHDGSLILTPELPTVLHFWLDQAGSEEVRTWVSEATSNDTGLACFLEEFLGVGFSQSVTSSVGHKQYRLDPKRLERYLGPSEVIDRVSTLADNTALTERQRIAVKQFLKEYKLRQEGKDPDIPLTWSEEED